MRAAPGLALAALVAVLVLLPGALAGPAPRSAAAGDQLGYTETIVLDGGVGNYTGYTEHSFINGSLHVTAILPNGTANTTYASVTHWVNNAGQTETVPVQGTFTFSPTTYHYVQGTDNQTGYVDPYVWFYIDAALRPGASFYLLNSALTVVGTNVSYPLASSPTGYVRTIFAEGNGSYQRNDVYGVFTATYTWKAYFDPGSGYIVGYLYTETDRDAAGDGFTWTDTLSVTSTSYALTPAAAPPAPPPTTTGPDYALIATVVVGALVLIVIVALALWAVRRRHRPELPRHAAPGTIAYDRASFPSPPGLGLGQVAQPPVQQIVLQETVKTNCRYCGTLIDTTATVCPKCGAPRT